MTEAQRDAIVGPMMGLMVFNLTSGRLNCFNGSAWDACGSGGGGATGGNGGPVSSSSTYYDSGWIVGVDDGITEAWDISLTTTYWWVRLGHAIGSENTFVFIESKDTTTRWGSFDIPEIFGTNNFDTSMMNKSDTEISPYGRIGSGISSNTQTPVDEMRTRIWKIVE